VTCSLFHGVFGRYTIKACVYHVVYFNVVCYTTCNYMYVVLYGMGCC